MLPEILIIPRHRYLKWYDHREVERVIALAVMADEASSIRGETRLSASSRRDGPPSCSANRNAPCRTSSSTSSRVHLRQGSRRAAFPFGLPPLHPSHEGPAPPVRRRVVDCSKHRHIGCRYEKGQGRA